MLSIQNPTFVGEAKQERHLYVQLEAELWSPNRAYLDGIADNKDLPFKIKDRDPRSSFEGWRGWAAKEAAIVNRYLETLPNHTIIVRGNLKLPPFASPEEHERAKAILSRAIKDHEKKTGRAIRFRAVADHNHPEDRHYDFVAYGDRYSFRAMNTLIKSAATKAGCKATCRPVNTKAQRIGTVRYVHKADLKPTRQEKFVYLPARDGSRLVWGSQDFFQGTSKTALWEECKAHWLRKKAESPASVQLLSNKQIDDPPLDELDAHERLARQVAGWLPDNPAEADSGRWTARKLHWCCPLSYLNAECSALLLPNIRQTPSGCYWVQRTCSVPTPATGRRTPYHAFFNPLPDERTCTVEEWEFQQVHERPSNLRLDFRDGYVAEPRADAWHVGRWVDGSLRWLPQTGTQTWATGEIKRRLARG
jgi:hypothetical protein